MAKELVSEPDRVQVTQVEGERAIICELRVAPGDLGKVIGRQGRIANAMRTVLKAAGAGQRKRLHLEIIDAGKEH